MRPLLHDHPLAAAVLARRGHVCSTRRKPRAPAPSRFARLGSSTAPVPRRFSNGVVVVTDDKIVAVGKQGVGDDSGRRARRSTSATPRCCRASSTRTRTSSAASSTIRSRRRGGARLRGDRRDHRRRRTRRRRCSAASRRSATSARRTSTTWRCAKRSSEGFVIGPRMQNAGHAIGITGGHCDENGFKPGLMDGNSEDRRRRRPRSDSRGRALSGEVRRRRHQDVRDRRRAVRGRRGRRAAVHLRGDEGARRRSDEARAQSRRARARRRRHQDRRARRRGVDRARLVPRRRGREDDGAARHVSRADAERRRGRREGGEGGSAQGTARRESAWRPRRRCATA